MNASIIPIQATEGGVPTVNARDLHAFLEVGKDFSNWIKDRIDKYGFGEGEDFTVSEVLRSPILASSKSRPQIAKEYHISLPMAKELAMVERNEKGRQARRYFIECERQLAEAQQPFQIPQTRAEALRLAAELEEQNERLRLVNAAMAPKVHLVDLLAETDGTYSMVEAAKLAQLPFGSTTLFEKLRAVGHLKSDKAHHNEPYQDFVNQGLYVMKLGRYRHPETRELMVSATTRVTHKGLMRIIEMFSPHQTPPPAQGAFVF